MFYCFRGCLNLFFVAPQGLTAFAEPVSVWGEKT